MGDRSGPIMFLKRKKSIYNMCSLIRIRSIFIYLRSLILKKRLNGLTTLCIKKDILDDFDIHDIVNDFTSIND